jgi:hypothetical protein
MIVKQPLVLYRRLYCRHKVLCQRQMSLCQGHIVPTIRCRQLSVQGCADGNSSCANDMTTVGTLDWFVQWLRVSTCLCHLAGVFSSHEATDYQMYIRSFPDWYNLLGPNPRTSELPARMNWSRGRAHKAHTHVKSRLLAKGWSLIFCFLILLLPVD